MSRISDLSDAYARELSLPWSTAVSGGERVWMLPYPPDLERQVRAALPLFKTRTESAGLGWSVVDITDEFGLWITGHKFAARLLSGKVPLSPQIVAGFHDHVVATITDHLRASGSRDVVALVGLGSVFPFLRASAVTKSVDPEIRGRMLVLFPGSHDVATNNFHFLNARDGFGYRAFVIDTTKDLP